MSDALLAASPSAPRSAYQPIELTVSTCLLAWLRQPQTSRHAPLIQVPLE